MSARKLIRQAVKTMGMRTVERFFARNIATRGRVARAVWGLSLIAAGVVVHSRSRWACYGLAAGGAFSLFEAARGWCIMRACGVKTRM